MQRPQSLARIERVTQLNSIKKALLGTSASSLATAFFTFFSGVLVARVLGPEARGDYGAALMLAQLAAAIGILSFYDGAIVILRRDNENALQMLPTLFATGIAITLFSIVGGLVVYRIFCPTFSNLSSKAFLWFSMGIIVQNTIVTLLSAVEQSQMSFTLVNFARFVGPALFALSTGTLWLLTSGTFQTLTVLLLFLVSRVPFFLAWAWKYGREYFGKISYSFARDAFATGIRLHGAVVLTLLANQMDRILGFTSWDKAQLGYYFVAFSAVGAGYSIITTAIQTVLFPYLAEKRSDGRTAEIARLFRLTGLLSIAFMLIGLVTLPFAVPLLYGQDYAAATHYAVALLLASAVLPVNALALQVGRASGSGLPSIQMAIVNLSIIFVGFWLTGYSSPMTLIFFVGISRILSTAVGIRNVLRLEGFQVWYNLLPRIDDIRTLSQLAKHRAGARKSGVSDE
jgi:O-antigen/teichoic acid export membrane protein